MPVVELFKGGFKDRTPFKSHHQETVVVYAASLSQIINFNPIQVCTVLAL